MEAAWALLMYDTFGMLLHITRGHALRDTGTISLFPYRSADRAAKVYLNRTSYALSCGRRRPRHAEIPSSGVTKRLSVELALQRVTPIALTIAVAERAAPLVLVEIFVDVDHWRQRPLLPQPRRFCPPHGSECRNR